MKRKLSIPSDRAAYAASQPLFDVLRHGCDTLDDMNQATKSCRDLVQGLHVKVDHSDTQLRIQQLLGIWQATISTYSKIFTEAAKLYEPLTGLPDNLAHVLLRNTVKVNDISYQSVQDFRSSLELHDITTLAGMEIPFADMPGDSSKDYSTYLHERVMKWQDGVETGHGKKAQRQSQVPRSEATSTEHSVNEMRQFPVELPSHEKAAKKRKISDSKVTDSDAISSKKPVNGKTRSPVELPSHESAAKKRKASNLKAPAIHAPPPAQRKATVSQVEAATVSAATNGAVEASTATIVHEDISAEVEARLKAKKEKHKAKRDDKKRKRKSNESSAAPAEAVNFERPKSKKPRVGPEPEAQETNHQPLGSEQGRNGTAVNGHADSGHKSKKSRRRDDDGEVVAGAEEGHKRRKKIKTSHG